MRFDPAVVTGWDVDTLLKTVSALGVTGLLVVIVWGAVKELWVTGRQYRRVLAERDAALAQVQKLNDLIASDVVPPLTRATDTQQQLLPLVQEALALMRAKP